MKNVLKPPVEDVYAHQLLALKANDHYVKPKNWILSPQFVKLFIVGGKTLEYLGKKCEITKKFFGDNELIERCVITLASNRPLILVGDPGTAKTMLSELLSAAISGTSNNTIQGSIGVSEENIKYSWNYSLLLSIGPCKEALVKAPLYRGMEDGIITRFEEITRCPLEVTDSLVSVLSDKVMNVAELGADGYLYAKPGFNIIATANTRDKGINEMSSALKRRFNFETVHPIKDTALSEKVIRQEVNQYLQNIGVDIFAEEDYLSAISQIFTDIRRGITDEGYKTDNFNAVMSTAEAVSTYLSSILDGYYFERDGIDCGTFNRNILAAVKKDNDDDVNKLKNYFDNIVKLRSEKLGGVWTEIYKNKLRSY